MTPQKAFGRVILRAFVASLIATVVGAELISLYVSFALSAHSEGSNSIGLFSAMILAAPLLAAPWVIPVGTVVASLLDPVANRLAPEKTARALAWLIASGALIGFALLFLLGLGVSLLYPVSYPQTSLGNALMLAQVYGPVFGGLTAFGWWLQSPHRTNPPGITVSA